MTTTSDLLGHTEIDPYGVILGTGYLRFRREDGLGGLAKTCPGRLDVLALDSLNPGHGAVRRFIHEAKEKFELIYVWHVENRILRDALLRYGFSDCCEPISFHGKIEWNDGMMWEKKETP